MATVDLMAAANFDENDLMANRQGHMSDKQIASLQRRQFIYILFLGVMIGTTLAIGLTVVLGTLNVKASSGGPDRISTFGILLFIALITYGIFKWSPLRKDIINGVVASTKGQASLRLIGARNLSYIVRLDKEDFEVSRKLYKSMMRGKSYQIYYAPQSRQVLSIEQVYS